MMEVEKMQKRIIPLAIVMLSVIGASGGAQCPRSRSGTETVNWKTALAKAQSKIVQQPSAAVWHNQAGVAYDALGDFANAERELKLASRLNPDNAIDDYVLYAMYKRRGMSRAQEKRLVAAIKKDPANPFGHFELGVVFEKEGKWIQSLREYRAAKLAVTGLNGDEYIDPRGNPYPIDAVRRSAGDAIDRLTKLSGAQVHEK